jgi:hypothetical protein
VQAIYRLEERVAKSYCLDLILHTSNKVRNKCIEIFVATWNEEILQKTSDMFVTGNYDQKKTILKLFSNVDGWEILSTLFQSVSDSDVRIQDLGWMYLQRWKDRAITLFTTPPQKILHNAIEHYLNTDVSRFASHYQRTKLWDEIKYYLR